MIGGVNNVSSQLSSIYNTNTEALADALSRIASGKRIQKPSDDFAGYLRARSNQSAISQFEVVKQDIQEGKGLAQFAVETGSAVMEDLQALKDLAVRYGATSDADEQALLLKEGAALTTKISNTIAEAQWDGTQVYAAGALDTITLDSRGSYGEIEIAMSAVAATAGLTITDSGASAQTQMESAATYLAEAKSFYDQLGDFMNLTDVTINSKEATRSLIEDVDDVKELAKMTDLQVRSQAAISMMAQANVSRQGIIQLFM